MPSKRRRDSRTALEELEQELRRWNRRNKPVSLVMLDVDDLEIYREKNGKKVAKEALAVWRRGIRPDRGRASELPPACPRAGH